MPTPLSVPPAEEDAAMQQWDRAVVDAKPECVAAAARELFALAWEAGHGDRAAVVLARHLQGSDSPWLMVNLEVDQLSLDASQEDAADREGIVSSSAIVGCTDATTVGPNEVAGETDSSVPGQDAVSAIIAEPPAEPVQPEVSNEPPQISTTVGPAGSGMDSGGTEEQLQAATSLRKLLSIERSPPIAQVIEAGALPPLIQCLSLDGNAQLQLEAAWALTNVAAGTGDQTREVIELGVIPHFVRLLASPHEGVKEQAVWALGNIAGDSTEHRDLVLQHGALPCVLDILSKATKLSLLRNTTWMLSNLLRGKPQPSQEHVQPAVPVLASLLFSNDEEVLIDALWAISYTIDETAARIQLVLDAGVAPRLLVLLSHSSHSVQTPALRAVASITKGSDDQMQALLDVGVLSPICAMLAHSKRGIRTEACAVLSNITSGAASKVEAVVKSDAFPQVISMAQHAEFEVRHGALRVLSNALSGGTPEHVALLVQHGCVPPLCEALCAQDASLLTVCLEGLDKLLQTGVERKGAGVNPYAELVEEAGGLNNLEKLQQHANEEVYEKAVKLLKMHFDEEEEEEEGVEKSPVFDDSQPLVFNGVQPLAIDDMEEVLKVAIEDIVGEAEGRLGQLSTDIVRSALQERFPECDLSAHAQLIAAAFETSVLARVESDDSDSDE